MNKYIFKEATKMALLTTSTLSKLITEFYDDIKAFAQMLQFTPDEIENMDKTTAEKLISKYID